MDLEKKKLYYSISDVSKLLELSQSVIRFWEKQFIVLNPLKKNKKSKRKYLLKDIQVLYKIKTLLYVEKYTIKGANEKLQNWKPNLNYEEFYDLFYKNENSTSNQTHFSSAKVEIVKTKQSTNNTTNQKIIAHIDKIKSLLNKFII